jgi:hypothetical protein
MASTCVGACRELALTRFRSKMDNEYACFGGYATDEATREALAQAELRLTCDRRSASHAFRDSVDPNREILL